MQNHFSITANSLTNEKEKSLCEARLDVPGAGLEPAQPFLATGF
jgi:hypothetical protein